MKLRNSFIYLAISAITFSACTSDIEKITNSKENAKLTFTADDFKYANQQTRTSFDITEEGAKFSWSQNDTVGIFPDQGSQVFFSMAAGSGTNTASFDGGGWALKSSSTYAAYYPFKGNIYLDKTAIPLSYEGQIQVGNNSTEHLGAYDYMAAVASTPENGNVNFNFKHLGALVQLNIPLENACSLTSIILRTDEKSFVTDGTLDLTSSTIKLNALETSDELTLALKDINFDTPDQEATIYFMIAPVDLSGKRVDVQVYTTDTTLPITYSFIGKNFMAGSAYAINATPNTTVDKAYAISLSCVGEILDINHEPLTRSETSNIYEITVKADGIQYATGSFDNIDNLTINLLEGKKYSFNVSYTLDSSQKPTNEFKYSVGSSSPGIIIGLEYYRPFDVYYGFIDEYTPIANGHLEIYMKRMSFGLKLVAEDLSEGISIKPRLKRKASDTTTLPPNTLTYDSPSFEGIYSFEGNNSWDEAYQGVEVEGEYVNYFESAILELILVREDGIEVNLGAHDIIVERNKITNVSIKTEDITSKVPTDISITTETEEMTNGKKYVIDANQGTITELSM